MEVNLNSGKKKKLNFDINNYKKFKTKYSYMRNEIIIENASLKDFLMGLIKNLGRNEVSTASW